MGEKKLDTLRKTERSNADIEVTGIKGAMQRAWDEKWFSEANPVKVMVSNRRSSLMIQIMAFKTPDQSLLDEAEAEAKKEPSERDESIVNMDKSQKYRIIHEWETENYAESDEVRARLQMICFGKAGSHDGSGWDTLKLNSAMEVNPRAN